MSSPCPYFNDFVRTCKKIVGDLPPEAYSYIYCSGEKNYASCVIHKVVENIGYHCKYMEKGPMNSHFKAKNLAQFVRYTNLYCLSEINNKKCVRFKKRESGETPPPNLAPDGSIIE